MTRLHRLARRPARTGLRRAATMIEFALVLPIFLFMMLFTVDMGSMMLMSGAMSDTAFTAARAGAQAGGAGVQPRNGAVVCYGVSGTCRSGVAAEVVAHGLEQMPMAAHMYEVESGVGIRSGASCEVSGANEFVKVDIHYTVKMLTPGLTSLLKVAGPAAESSLDGFQLTATGVARCEVFREQ